MLRRREFRPSSKLVSACLPTLATGELNSGECDMPVCTVRMCTRTVSSGSALVRIHLVTASSGI